MTEPETGTFAEYTITASGCLNSDSGSPEEFTEIVVQSNDDDNGLQSKETNVTFHLADENDDRIHKKAKKKRKDEKNSKNITDENVPDSNASFPGISFIDTDSESGTEVSSQNELQIQESDSSNEAETSQDRRASKWSAIHESDSSIEPEPETTQGRRASKWSATILFVASDVQLMFNLAEFNPDEGFERAPPKVNYQTQT